VFAVPAAMAALSLLGWAAAYSQPVGQPIGQTSSQPIGQTSSQTNSQTSAQASQAAFPVLKGPYLGQKLPGMTPEVFAPGIVSTAAHEFSCTFTPDGKEFFFARRHPTLNQVVLMTTRLRDSVWTEPEVAPFVENEMSFEPSVTPDGKRLYYQCGKPMPGKPGPSMNVLYVEREGNGWSKAKDPGAPLNPSKAMRISVAKSGTIYATDISQGMGTEAIAVSRKVEGQYQPLERMGAPIATGSQTMYPFVAPDESYLIYGSKKPAENPADKAKDILSISFRKPDGTWGEPRTIELGIEGSLPQVSPDGKFLFFTAGERGKSDIYWVSAAVIDNLRPKEPRAKDSQ
jgi:hypothetical protein